MMELLKPVDTEFRRWHRFMRERNEAAVLLKGYGVGKRFLRELIASVQPTLEKDDYAYRVRFANSITWRRFAATGFVVAVGVWLAQSDTTSTRLHTDEVVWLFLVLQQMVVRLRDIADADRVIARDRPRITAYRRALDTPTPRVTDAGDSFTDNEISLRFEHVSLTLGDVTKQKDILYDVSFTIATGERVGILGPSGAGKSKLIELILGAYEPTAGKILINDQSLETLHLDQYLSRVGYIPQDIEVFEGTIREAILTAIPDEDCIANQRDEFLLDVLERSGLDQAILTDGLATKVGYRGLKLSGGQRQRLAIAVALAKEPVLLVGDEMTSALDSVSEGKVMRSIYSSTGRTIIMIAHRLSTLNSCDKLLFVRPLSACADGQPQVVVYSSYAEVYAAEALFREMADEQGFAA